MLAVTTLYASGRPEMSSWRRPCSTEIMTTTPVMSTPARHLGPARRVQRGNRQHRRGGTIQRGSSPLALGDAHDQSAAARTVVGVEDLERPARSPTMPVTDT